MDEEFFNNPAIESLFREVDAWVDVRDGFTMIDAVRVVARLCDERHLTTEQIVAVSGFVIAEINKHPDFVAVVRNQGSI